MAIRKIDVSKMTPVAVKPPARPVLAFIAVSDLIIDERYQRSIERSGLANIKKIANNFDWAKFSPVIVSKRSDGKFAVIDGQHRAHAAALCGFSEVPAMISELSIEQEAASFSWINGSVTSLSANQIFKAALAAFEPWAVQCNAAVSASDCKLMTANYSGAAKKPKQVFCVGLVRRFVEQGNSAALAAVLKGIISSDYSELVHYYNSFGLSVLVPAAVTLGVTQPEAIADFLNANDLDNVAHKVRVLQDLPEHRGKSFKSMFALSVLVLMRNHMRGEAV